MGRPYASYALREARRTTGRSVCPIRWSGRGADVGNLESQKRIVGAHVIRTSAWISAGLSDLHVAASVARGQATPASKEASYRLRPGPQLFIDDFLIARAEGVVRRVIEPRRFLDAPVLTGAGGHLNWQPWLTV